MTASPRGPNPLLALGEAGQAVWLDYLHRKILDDGELKRLIKDDGLKGMTSNPSIFEKAIGEGDAYDARLRRLMRYRYNNVPTDVGGRYFYINDGGEVWNPSFAPTNTALDAFECRHGLG